LGGKRWPSAFSSCMAARRSQCWHSPLPCSMLGQLAGC
jgi:hypothetical protein